MRRTRMPLIVPLLAAGCADGGADGAAGSDATAADGVPITAIVA